MSKFGQDVKSILNDVYHFLTTAIKDLQLSSDVLAQKKQILAAIDAMRKEYSALTPAAAVVEGQHPEIEEVYDDANAVPELPAPRTTSNTLTAPTPAGVTSEYHTPSSLEVISDVAATTLTKPLKSGFLQKERKKSGILSLSTTFQKRYCVIQDGVFYYFEKSDSKKQSGAFRLDDYEAAPFTDSSQKPSAHVFQVTCPGKRSYIFKADDNKEMLAWIDMISNSCSIKRTASVERKGSMVAARIQDNSMNDTYDDNTIRDDVYDETIDSASAKTEPGADVYDDTGAASPPPSTPKLSGTALVKQPSAPTQIQRPVPPTPVSSLPPSVPNVATQEPDEAPEELYDFVDDTPAKPLPATPTVPTSRPLPPPPVAAPPETIVARKDDYASMYYGMWDCVANKSFELSFSSGDMLHVISSKYEDSGWWTAVLNGKVGLVPKNYLTPAYIRV